MRIDESFIVSNVPNLKPLTNSYVCTKLKCSFQILRNYVTVAYNLYTLQFPSNALAYFMKISKLTHNRATSSLNFHTQLFVETTTGAKIYEINAKNQQFELNTENFPYCVK